MALDEEPALRLDQLPPDALRLIAAECIGPNVNSNNRRRAEAGRLRAGCKALRSAAEAALASGLVRVLLEPRSWPPPSMGVLTRCARHLHLYFCRGQVTDEAVRVLAEAAPRLAWLSLWKCRHVTDVSALASIPSLRIHR